MDEQISIFDFMDDAKKDLPLGYLRTDAEVKRYKGDVIPFQGLEKYIGKQVLCEVPTIDRSWYKVVIMTSYHKDCDEVYDYREEDAKLIGKCDRVGYSDDNRYRKETCWVSEHFVRNGRYHNPEDKCSECFYELKE